MLAIAEILRAHRYCAGLDEGQIEALARLATLRSIDRGEILALEGDPCEAVYLAVEGRLRAVKMSPQGREQVVNEIRPGEAFYIVPALDSAPLPVTVQAVTAATVLRFARDDFLNLLQTYPSLALGVLRDLAGRLRRLSSLVEDLALRSVPQRLAKLLLERAASPATRRMTQREMAAMLGTVREVVARTLSQFDSRGWVHVRRGRIEIVDAEALRRMAYEDDSA